MKIRIIRDLELPNSAYTKGQIMSIEIDYKGRKVFENMFNLLIKAGYAEEIKDFKNNFKIEDDAAFIPCNECKNRIDEFAGSVICEECTFSNMSNSDKIDFNNKIIKLILDKNIENKEIENTASNNIQDKDKLYKQYLEEAEDILGSLKRDGTLNFEGAISIYSKAIELDPYNIEGYLKRGGAKIEIEAYQEAIEDCNKVIELSPKNEKAFKMRGFSKYCLKDYTGALGDYYKVLEYNPNDKSIKDDIDFVTLSIQKEKINTEDIEKVDKKEDKLPICKRVEKLEKYITDLLINISNRKELEVEITDLLNNNIIDKADTKIGDLHFRFTK